MALLKYILKKMLMLLPVLIGISIIAFALGIMSPGDPVDQVLNPNGNESYTQAEYDAMAAKMGLDQPAVVQYFNWVDGLAHGDLGRSFFTNKSVMDQLAKRIPISLKLAGFSIILTIVFGVGSGVLMAVKKDRLLDHVLLLYKIPAKYRLLPMPPSPCCAWSPALPGADFGTCSPIMRCCRRAAGPASPTDSA